MLDYYVCMCICICICAIAIISRNILVICYIEEPYENLIIHIYIYYYTCITGYIYIYVYSDSVYK